jgi:Coenzyme PQQ synthesis protein D (PqqD)
MSADLKLTDTVSQAPDHLATELGGRFILMSIEQGAYCGLDDIGSDIWRRLASPLTVEQLCETMAAEYQGDRDQITADVLSLLASLRDERLIHVG